MTGKRSSALCHMTWVLSAPPSSQNQPAGLQEIEGGGQCEHRKLAPVPESQKERVECVKSVKSFPFTFRNSSFGFYQDQSLNDHPATKCANVCYRAVKRLMRNKNFGSSLFYGPVPHVHTTGVQTRQGWKRWQTKLHPPLPIYIYIYIYIYIHTWVGIAGYLTIQYNHDTAILR